MRRPKHPQEDYVYQLCAKHLNGLQVIDGFSASWEFPGYLDVWRDGDRYVVASPGLLADEPDPAAVVFELWDNGEAKTLPAVQVHWTGDPEKDKAVYLAAVRSRLAEIRAWIASVTPMSVSDLWTTVNDTHAQWDEGEIDDDTARRAMLAACRQYTKDNDK